MIYYFTPYSDEHDLTISYSRIMDYLPNDDDWACITDADSMFIDHNFGDKIRETIEANPEYELLTCMTNRVANPSQVVPGVWDKDSMHEHKQVAQDCWDRFGTQVENITHKRLLSGVMIMTTKKAWREKGPMSFSGMLGVDNRIHKQYKACGKKVGIMNGVYLLHYYRNGRVNDTAHLK